MPSPPRESDQFYDLERFFNYAVDMFCIADTKGFFRRVNPSFERVLGYNKDELLEKPFVSFVHPDDHEQTLAETGKLASGQATLSFENRYRCKDGSYKYLHWTSYPEPKTGTLYAVARDVTEQRLRESRMDGITGVPNRRVWDEALASEWRRDARLGVPLAIALLDVDGLRSYNDARGHLEGDKCLCSIAGTLAGRLRRTGDLVVRYYGGTFGLLFAGGVDLEHATGHCETLRQAVEQLNLQHPAAPVDGRVTISGGVAAVIPNKDGAPEPLVNRAGSALSQAKSGGRNRIVTAEQA